MTSLRQVLVLQHTPPETLGTIADGLDAHEVSARYVLSFNGESVPENLEAFSGLVVMGGPMGVYDQDRHPFLKEEMHLLELALKQDKPILGVCLGSQMLASVLGASITRRRDREIGWHRVELTETGQEDRIWKGTERSFFAYHWHRDVFDLPKDAVSLASSKITQHQVFRYGERVYGLLFHLEMTENMVREMIRTFSDELAEEQMDGGRLMEEGGTHFPPLEKIARSVFGRWAELIP